MPGTLKSYHIEYLSSVVKKDIPAISAPDQKVIQRAVETRLILDPVGFGKPLRYSLKGHRRLRVGNYRIVYRIEAKENKVIIIAIKHRKDIYEKI